MLFKPGTAFMGEIKNKAPLRQGKVVHPHTKQKHSP